MELRLIYTIYYYMLLLYYYVNGEYCLVAMVNIVLLLGDGLERRALMMMMIYCSHVLVTMETDEGNGGPIYVTIL